MKNIRLRAMIVVVIILIIVLASSLLINKPLTYNISQGYLVSTNLSAVEGYGSNSFVYSNGQSLMLYNYSTGTASQLGPSVGLSNSGIDTISVSQDDQYVVFHDEQVGTGSLYNQLQNAGLDPQNDYWLLYSVATQTYQPLPQTTILAKPTSNGVEALASVAGVEELINYSYANLTPQSTINISGINDFFVANGGVILQTPSNKVLFTTNGTVSQQLAGNAVVLAITPDNQDAVVTVTQKGANQLSLLNLQTHSEKTIASNIIGPPAWSSSGAVLYTASDGKSGSKLYSYDMTTKKTYVWDFVGGATKTIGQSTLAPVGLVGAQAAVVSNSSTSYYLVGNALAKPQVSL